MMPFTHLKRFAASCKTRLDCLAEPIPRWFHDLQWPLDILGVLHCQAFVWLVWHLGFWASCMFESFCLPREISLVQTLHTTPWWWCIYGLVLGQQGIYLSDLCRSCPPPPWLWQKYFCVSCATMLNALLPPGFNWFRFYHFSQPHSWLYATHVSFRRGIAFRILEKKSHWNILFVHTNKELEGTWGQSRGACHISTF